jgi:hypothetical protein
MMHAIMEQDGTNLQKSITPNITETKDKRTSYSACPIFLG